MTDSNHTHDDRIDAERLTDAEILRAHADGEMSDELRDKLKGLASRDSKLDDRVAYERSLRDAVSRVMGSTETPAGLRDSVLGAMRQEGASADEQSTERGPIPFPGAEKPERHWSRPWWIGVAAMVAIVLGASFFYPFGSSTQPTPGGTGGPIAQDPLDEFEGEQPSIQRVAEFVEQEGSRCAYLGDLAGDKKFVYRSAADAQAAAIKLLNRVPDVIDLPDGRLAALGYEFAGLGECHLPLGDGPSAHLIYRTSEAALPSISLWVQKDTGDLCKQTVKSGACYGLSEKLAKKKGGSVNVWRQDGLIYVLFIPRCESNKTDDLVDPARKAFHAPELVRDLTL